MEGWLFDNHSLLRSYMVSCLDIFFWDSRHSIVDSSSYSNSKLIIWRENVTFFLGSMLYTIQGSFFSLQESLNTIQNSPKVNSTQKYIWPRVDFLVKQLTKVKLLNSTFFSSSRHFILCFPFLQVHSKYLHGAMLCQSWFLVNIEYSMICPCPPPSNSH